MYRLEVVENLGRRPFNPPSTNLSSNANNHKIITSGLRSIILKLTSTHHVFCNSSYFKKKVDNV